MARPKEGGLDFDVILDELGGFGRYQIRTYCLILLPIILTGAYNGQYIFAAGETPYRCLVPECEAAPVEWEPDDWGEWTLKESAKCERLKPLGNTCKRESFHSSVTTECTAFVYENNYAIVSEFDLACQEWKRTLVGTAHSLGNFTALFIVGFLSDSFGRRVTFILTASLRSLGGVIRAFSANYTMYIVFEYVEAFISSGVYSTGFILALEMISLKRRVLAGSMMSASFALGQMLLAVVAWNIPYWRTLTLLIYAPSILFLLYCFCIEESVRWLLSKGEKKEASRIIFKAANVNNSQLSPQTIKLLLEEPSPEPESTNAAFGPTPPRHCLAKQVLKSRILMSRLAICTFWWITVTFIYYGLSINSVSLGGNKYVNYILTSLVELPGYCISILTLDRFGRKSSIMTSFFVCGTSLIALPFVPDTWVWVPMALNLVGKMFASMVISSIYVYTMELFPTQVRHRVLAFCCMAGRLGEMSAPQTPLLVGDICRWVIGQAWIDWSGKQINAFLNVKSISMLLTLLGKLCISMVFTSLYIYTMELFPTQVRHSLMGFCSASGRIGSVCAPQTPLLMVYMKSLPYLMFGVMALCAGALMLLTPETLNMRLPDTVAEAEDMASAPHIRRMRTDIIDDKFNRRVN